MAGEWATPADVIDAWIGDGTPSDDDKLALWIGRAERKIRREVPSLVERLAKSPPEQDLVETVRDVIVAMVTRTFRNPEGVRSTQRSTGPFSTGITYGGDTPGELTLTEEERAALVGVTSTGGAFAVDTIPTGSEFSAHAGMSQRGERWV